MFGYVTANEPELKVKDYHKYKAYYCGLCQSLKRQYGSAGQLTLAYDMTFVIILLTSLYESETKAESHRCKMHPLKPQPMLENEITEYAVASREISQAVIRRLPRYYRYLGELLESGVERISSNELSKRMKVTASQIRQDLNNFGGFGQQGYGYNVKYLYTEIGKILGLNEKHKFVIIGAGNLGQALANYAAFENRGFVLKGLFDVNPRLAGLTIRGVEIRMMDELKDFVKENDIEIGVLTIPKTKAVEVANLLVDNGVKAIWNFAHTDLNLPDNIIVENVHLSESLMRLSYNITRYNEEHEGK